MKLSVTNKRRGSFGQKITAEIGPIQNRRVRAKIPGEYSGSSIVFKLKISNGSDRQLDLNPLVVNVIDSAKSPTNEITSSPATGMPNLVAPGHSASATYVFVVAKNRRDPVTIDVTISPRMKVVVFKGDAR